LITSCTWVKDDEDCDYGFWLNLHYTYNILDVEAAPEYIDEVSIYIYDTTGNYVKRIDVSQQDLKAKNHRVLVEGLDEGDYQFVVWSGINKSQYAIMNDRTKMQDFRLSLAGSSLNSAIKLPDLYYGKLSTVHYDEVHAVHDVYMIKNTNELACGIVTLSKDVKFEPDEFTMKIVSANGTMDVQDSLVSDKLITYEPYKQDTVTINDDQNNRKLHGIESSISTLRLMEKTDSRLILEKKSTGQQLVNISFPEFIGMVGPLYTNLGRPLTVQEYLDRQDFFSIIFILSEDLNQLLDIQINSWRVRLFDDLKI
jgi:hypothetical protein